MRSIQARPIALVGIALALALGPITVSTARAADVSPDMLDEIEQTICIADSNWTNSLQESARRRHISAAARSPFSLQR